MSTANTDEHMRYELLAREMFLSDLATDLDAAEKKGIEKGIEKAKAEDAINMLQDGLSVEKVCKYTGLSADQVENLAKKHTGKVSEACLPRRSASEAGPTPYKTTKKRKPSK